MSDSGTPLVIEIEAEPEELQRGTMVGEYELETLIGKGGMGEVYGARHPVIGKRVAVKVMNRVCSADPINVERFVHEAKAVNAIGHSNIVDIFAFGRTQDERCYFVMEWLQGESLRARLDRGAPTGAQALDILDGVLRALEAAHAAGIVHRDLKPDNIFLLAAKDDQPERVKLLDFGIAKLSGDRGPRPSMTRSGTVIGTPTHMSPEQAMGAAIGRATDIYSLGVVAFELATGRLPFNAESTVQLMAKHIDCEPPRPSDVRPVPPALEQLVLDMLAKDPDARPTATGVRERVAALRADPAVALAPVAAPTPSGPRETQAPTRLDRPVTPRPVSAQPPALAVETAPTGEAAPPRSRRPWLALAGAGVLAAIAIVIVVRHRGSTGASPPDDTAAPAAPAPPAAAAPTPTAPAPPPTASEPAQPGVVAPAEPAHDVPAVAPPRHVAATHAASAHEPHATHARAAAASDSAHAHAHAPAAPATTAPAAPPPPATAATGSAGSASAPSAPAAAHPGSAAPQDVDGVNDPFAAPGAKP